MNIINFSQLQNKGEKICVVGLGYVGLPLAILLAKKYSVIGYDISRSRINELKNGIDRTEEVERDHLSKTNLEFTTELSRINEAKFIIIAVPTPIDENKNPNLDLVKKATTNVGRNLTKGSIVVYESTVYPGVTEDICLPILEKESGLKNGQDFKIGYSPERVNPGDKEHAIDRIVKVVSGQDAESLKTIDRVYGSITAGTFKARSIKVAEAAKVVENTQRDINIALINEITILCGRLGISIYDVLDAAGTKWNFINFVPGLVGGDCIGANAYYLSHLAEKLGISHQMISSGRQINENMASYIGREIIREMVKLSKMTSLSRVAILGITFKENASDIRNSKIVDLYKELNFFGLKTFIYDPKANPEEVKHKYGIDLISRNELINMDAIIVAVAHAEFKKISANEYVKMMHGDKYLIGDIKHILAKEDLEKAGFNYWSL